MSPPRASFLALPQELRDHVYSYLQLSSTRKDRHIRIGPVTVKDDHRHGPEYLEQYIALSSTCRTIYSDVAAVFWGHNIFRFTHLIANKQPILASAAGKCINHITLETPADDAGWDPIPMHVWIRRDNGLESLYLYNLVLRLTRKVGGDGFEVELEIADVESPLSDWSSGGTPPPQAVAS